VVEVHARVQHVAGHVRNGMKLNMKKKQRQNRRIDPALRVFTSIEQ
jgi:hypothetical protein